MSNSQKDYLRWLEQTRGPFVAKAKERREHFETSSNIEVPPLPIPDDTKVPSKVGFAGEFPFTRGVYPSMYRGRFWTMRQYAGMGDADASNERYRFLLSQGVMGLSVAFDLPTQIGYDSDHAMATGEVG
ncbi:MAG: methylmalonyl-CoA mutase, partial [Planctomycetes bacterium]|nr:methylmalonyl-CoA mutase [Planctomycetota bacterium]